MEYDPVTRMPFRDPGFACQPFATVLVGGQMMPLAKHDLTAMSLRDKEVGLPALVTQTIVSGFSQIVNMVTKLTPFDDTTDFLFGKLHCIAFYISAMVGRVQTQFR